MYDSSLCYNECFDDVKPEDKTNVSNINVPKIIMQSWKTKTVPLHWMESPQSIQTYMSEWKYILMDDKDNREMVKKHFPDFFPYYERYPYDIQRADTARYCFLYLYGGVYMDLDYVVQKNLSTLFLSNNDESQTTDQSNNESENNESENLQDTVYLVPSGNVGTYFTNSFMASTPKNKFWLEVLEECKKPRHWLHISRHLEIMGVSGPAMLSRVANSTKIKIITIQSNLIMPCSVCNLSCDCSNSYLKQLEGSSWIGFDSQIYLFFLCNWKLFILFSLIFIFLIFLIFITYK